ncbi:MAG: MotA/TolQ/ExbB proton channel family protein [Cyanobacteriota bacterium]
MLLQQLSLGGPVMVPLLVLSIAVVTIAVDRFRFWRQLGTAGSPRWQRFEAELSQGQASSLQASDGPVGRLMARLREAGGESDRQLELQLAIQKERTSMARGERVLEAAAALGPLLGLLGTVTGLMRTFSGLGQQRDTAASATLAAAGIAEVLVATAMGILVAVLAIVVLRINAAYRQSQLALMERVALAHELSLHRQAASHG